MGHLLSQLVTEHGYLMVAVLVFAEGVGLPLPGETALVAAAAFAAQSHRLSIVGVVLAAFAGAAGGGIGGYWIGRTGGMGLVERYGRYLGVTRRRIARARAFFSEHGPKAVFTARFIAIVRMFAGVLAGVTRMPFGRFSLYNTLGALVWSALFGTLGYVFGNNLPHLEHLIGRTSLIVLAAVLVLGMALWHRRAAFAMEK
jgi:membrane protein DedA with SNARE-associated domain